MGIVSHCPNGHRVKVKDYLAGKTGICPSCGARFRIPVLNTPTPGTFQAQLPSGLPIADVASLDREVAASPPPALVLAGAMVPPVERKSTVKIPPAAITEVSSASWCIAVPGGQPSSAMSGAALFDWLTSGTVTGGELVWRSDWSDWRPVAEVFPDHMPPAGSRSPSAW